MRIPSQVQTITETLQKKGFEAYLVGGCVRDILCQVEPGDWDVATNAEPEEIVKIFPKNFYENKFGTVTVVTKSKNPKTKEVEVTPYRIDEKYTDKRHPGKIYWAKTIEEDLARRDFTVNAMALKPSYNTKHITHKKKESSSDASRAICCAIIDPFDGQRDLKKKIIRAVGNPKDRFAEDALRMMRAVRLATTLGFSIEPATSLAIKENSRWLQAISKERIRDEFLKIIDAEKAAEGIELLRQLGLLKYIVPELEEGYKVGQNKHHIYDCYEHALRSLAYTAKKNFSREVRIAALLHDIAKPKVKRGSGADATFYGHEIVGAKMTAQILERLNLPKKDIERIAKFVRYHLFYYNVGEVTEASVRRLVSRIGAENIEGLLQIRMADRIGSGVPKAEPYKLRHLKYIIEKVAQDPVSVKMLKVNGGDVMTLLALQPGPKVGQILDILLGIVLSDPRKNKREFLKKEIKKLGELSENELARLSKQARSEREKIEIKRDEMTKQKYWVT